MTHPENARVFVPGILITILGISINLAVLYSTSTVPHSAIEFGYLGMFYIWANAPLLILLMSSFLFRHFNFSREMQNSLFCTTILTAAFLLWAYLSVLHDKSSTASLAFVILPFYTIPAIPFVFVICLVGVRIAGNLSPSMK